MRFQRVTFGVNCSPFLLNATIRHHLAIFPESRVIEELQENLYVDDWLSGADSDEEAVEMFSTAREVMLKAGMSLSKWSSNSKMVTEKAYLQMGGNPVQSDSMKILGVKWLSSKDAFSFEGVMIPPHLVTTKRVILSFLARLYDPLGFLAPYVMVAKCLFQSIWQMGLQWDDEVPEEVHSVFSSWLSGLEMLKKWEIPRCYSSLSWTDHEGIELHVFGDAAEKGYGAVVYLRVPQSDGTFTASLVVAKARVAPLKKVSLPRLELLGSLLAARLLRFVLKALKLPDSTRYYCWTDSMVALSWIKGSPAKWKQFVANRVSEIQELSSPASWFFCPGKENPADLTTRGVQADTLVSSKLWLNGPSWLSGLYKKYPGASPDEILEDELSGVENELVLLNTTSSPEKEVLFKVERWSSFSKAMRIVAWVLRFVRKLPSDRETCSTDLSYEELSHAKILLFKEIQRKAYSSEIDALKRGKSIPKGSPILKLAPFVDEDGLLKVKGRLQLSDLAFEEKTPDHSPKLPLVQALGSTAAYFLEACWGYSNDIIAERKLLDRGFEASS
jgi:hypothetical protein